MGNQATCCLFRFQIAVSELALVYGLSLLSLMRWIALRNGSTRREHIRALSRYLLRNTAPFKPL